MGVKKLEIKKILENIENAKKNKKRCEKCVGSGFIKMIPIICNICDGIKCIQCNSKGITIMPYDLCERCDSSGEVFILV